MRKLFIILPFLFLILLICLQFGCATVSDINRIQPGMTQEQVENQIGSPHVRFGQSPNESSEYRFFDRLVGYIILAPITLGLILPFYDKFRTSCFVSYENKIVNSASCPEYESPEAVDRRRRIGNALNEVGDEYQSNAHPTSSAGIHHCGLKPLPEVGCHIGNCVNGRWENVCN